MSDSIKRLATKRAGTKRLGLRLGCLLGLAGSGWISSVQAIAFAKSVDGLAVAQLEFVIQPTGRELVDNVLTQTNDEPTQISDIRIEFTEAGELNIVIKTTSGQIATPRYRTSGNALIAEINNAILALPEGDSFEQFAPTDDIALIQASTQSDDRVEILITGSNAPPTAITLVDEAGLVLSVIPSVVSSLSEETETAEDRLQLVVTATRTAEEIQSVPRSVTVITREDIAEQTRITPDLGAALGQLVPGFATSTGTTSEFGQSLRGRTLAVLIDGVPQSTSRNAFRTLRTIDPDAIERIEVLRGPTAVYGNGATGGVVNIITRTPTDRGLAGESRVTFEATPTNISDSFGSSLFQSVSGQSDNADFVITGSFRSTGGFFDGEGNRIPADPNSQGGLSDADTINVLGKIGIDLTDEQRLQISLNHYSTRQDAEFTTDPVIADIPGRQRSQALFGLTLETPQRTTNTVLNFDYEHNNVFDGKFTSQLYHRDYASRFFPFDARAFDSLGNVIFQSEVDSEQLGGRLQFDTPLFDSDRFLLTWGADFNREDISQPLNIFEPDAFDSSSGLTFNTIGTRIWVPPFQQRTLGLFTQANWRASDNLRFLGGIRHERVGVSVDDFTTLAGNNITGGELNYDATLFNLGSVLYLSENVSIFASFAQGFSLADVGLVLRGAPPGFSVETLQPEAQRVNHYEVGIRGQWDRLQASLSGFYNESELGTTFTAPGEIVRAPERIYGVEATLDAQLSKIWLLGSTVSWQEGENDIGDTGEFTPLSGFRIAPLKVTAYLENQTTPGWRNRIQALYSGGRDRFANETVFGQREVDGYFTLDYISSIDLGSGSTLDIGVKNLLGTDYFPVVSQLQPNELQNAAAPGRFITVGYSHSW